MVLQGQPLTSLGWMVLTVLPLSTDPVADPGWTAFLPQTREFQVLMLLGLSSLSTQRPGPHMQLHVMAFPRVASPRPILQRRDVL